MKAFKIIYYAFISLILAVAILLILSIFPVTGNFKIFTVLSGSMEPAIKIGSVVVIRQADEYRVGDVITFGADTKSEVPITHRIYEIKNINGEAVYTTKGDANNAPDIKELQKTEILGKVLFNVPYFGYAISAVQKPVGFALVIIIPVVLIIYDEIRKIWRELAKKSLENKQ